MGMPRPVDSSGALRGTNSTLKLRNDIEKQIWAHAYGVAIADVSRLGRSWNGINGFACVAVADDAIYAYRSRTEAKTPSIFNLFPGCP